MASGWGVEDRGSNPGTSRQPLTPGCLKQQNIPNHHDYYWNICEIENQKNNKKAL